jgi:hypothetical protein
MHVGTGLAPQQNELLEALKRGREDHEFFGAFFLNRKPHPGQKKWLENANATLNCLATANRYGKTTLIPHGHFHSGIYKIGAEPFYFTKSRITGQPEIDLVKFAETRYHTVHTAGEWETARIVWDEAHKLIHENVRLLPFIKEWPKSIPPHIRGHNGWLWKFRTLGHDSRGIDGNSFYLITIDEAGWIDGLEEMTQNVIRIRVADVRGRIWFVGTFKPGISRDFYKYCFRASAATGINIAFDHRDDVDDNPGASVDTSLASSIRKYLREFGIDLDEYADAIAGDGNVRL